MADNSGVIEPKIFDLQSDQAGNWNMEIGEKLEAGPHVVTIQDDKGNQYQVMMYVVGEEKDAAAAPASFIPGAFLYAFLALIGIIIVLNIYILFLAKKADREEEEKQQENTIKRKNQTRKAMLFCVFALMITLLAGLIVNRETNFISRIFQTKKTVILPSVKVVGGLINPQTLSGVAGVDLIAGSTNIKTAAAGQFIFGRVDTAQGIKATEPRLLRTLAFIPAGIAAEERMDIYFDVDMFNTLIRLTDLEARGQRDKTFDFLPKAIKEKTNLVNFLQTAKTIFTPKNVPDQEIKVAGTKLINQWHSDQYDLSFNKVVEVTLAANGQTDRYYLVNTDEGWKVIK
jgi:hypothetical protein